MSRIIALSGCTGVGRATLADFLVAKHGYTKIGIADPIWDDVSDMFTIPAFEARLTANRLHAQDRFALVHADNPDYRAWVKHNLSWDCDPYEPRTTQWHARYYGDEFSLQKDRLRWTNHAIDRMRLTQGNIVIPDLRDRGDMRELSALQRAAITQLRQLTVFEVMGPNSTRNNMGTDYRLPAYVVQGCIHNRFGALEEAYADLERLMGETATA